MSDNKNDLKDFEGLGKLLDHDYDDIRELDNPLPGWWLLTFYGTVVFAVGYYIYYTFAGGPNMDQELAESLQAVTAQVQQQQSQQAQQPQTDLAALAAKPEVLEKGRTEYAGKCMACHGAKGEGMIGPNLTDDFWIHGDGSLDAIKVTVQKGVLEKGMPAWEAAMSPGDLDAVVVFVRSLYGTNPPNAKAPQGDKKEMK